jgi:hypothetical protein
LQNGSNSRDKKDTKIKDYVIENADYLFIKFLQTLPKIGKYVKDIESKWKEIKNDFDNFSNEEFEDSKLNEFIQKIENQEGSIYENDFITSLINKKLNLLINDGIEPVLILDDIDRIEPIHIFRILNVFSSLYDNTNYKANKFDFSKIIIVGDISNIRSIYNHIYGYKADFDGYIDKFYSNQIYFLSFRESLKSQIKKLKYTRIYNVNLILIEFTIFLFDFKKLNFRQLRLIDKVTDAPENNESLLVIIEHLSIFYHNDLEYTINQLMGLDISFIDNRNLNFGFFENILVFMINDYTNQKSSKIQMSETDSDIYLFNFNTADHQAKFIKGNSRRDKYISLKENYFDQSQLIWQEFKYYLDNFEPLKTYS